MDYIKVSEKYLMDWLKNNLSEKRYQHSLGTGECARDLAPKYNINPDKAYITGLLHDCAKCFSNEKLLEIINEHLEIDESEKISYKTWHAPVSAYIVQKEFGVKDKEIISAIRWHTIGKIGMTDFEKLIYLADKIEPRTREDYYIEKISKHLNEPNGLNKAMLESYKETIKSLVERDLKICIQTVDIYNYLEDEANVN